MRHYEVVFMVHPAQSEQVEGMVERYVGMLTGKGAIIHRNEDWGRRVLAYTIGKEKHNKAHYVCLNIECSVEALDALTDAFRFNDAILRHLIIKREEAVTEPSLLLKSENEEKRAPRAQSVESDDSDLQDSDESAEEPEASADEEQ